MGDNNLCTRDHHITIVHSLLPKNIGILNRVRKHATQRPDTGHIQKKEHIEKREE